MIAAQSLSGLRDLLDATGGVIDAVGVAVIAVGILVSSALLAREIVHTTGDAYSRYRQRLGRGILLGLEFLVAGDIIRSVAVSPSFVSVGVLAIIVVVRTFLSFTLELEISGRWPWQPRT